MVRLSGPLRLHLRPSCRPPSFAMLADPIKQRPFETDIIAAALRLEPFVPEDFLPFGQEFLIER